MILDQIMDKEALYLQTVKKAYPELDIRLARLHTGEGQFNDILFVNEDLIFRFPRYQDSIRDFVREIKVLVKLQGFVSLPIPNPIYISSGTKSIGNIFMGYKLLPGKPLFRDELNSIQDERTLESIAHELANFLYRLHRLSHTTLGLDLPISDKVAEMKTFYTSIGEHLFSLMRPEARALVTRHFEDYFNNSRLHKYEPGLIHGDFGGSNILFDGEKVTGIIDFSFTGLGDPAQDLAAVSTYGDAFFTRICRHYPNIESLLGRAKFYRGTFALQEALHGYLNNDKDAFNSGMEEYV